MTTVTIKYDGRNALIESILNSAVLAGATIDKIIAPKAKAIPQANDFNIIAQHLFGERKSGKYTDNELFLINSKLNASKNFSKYL